MRAGIVAAWALALALPAEARARTPPTFVEAACDLPGVSAEVRPRLRCGTVSVERDPGRPEGGIFRLAVVVVRSAQQPSRPDPVVYISGGPGAPLTLYADHQARTPYAPGRDLILIDQRGTGRSEPILCPELNGRLLDATLAVAAEASDAALAARQAIYTACRDDARAHGIDLHQFGTAVTVEDFDSVRQALRIARWNVYGESYGTAVAMTLVARHPAAVRSVVLDSLYPPDPLPRRSALVAAARNAFFQSRTAAVPDLASFYQAALDRLDRAPLSVAVPRHQPVDRMRFTAALFEVLVANLIYYPPNYPGLPRLIEAARAGDPQRLGEALTSVVDAAAALNMAALAAVECRDRPRFRMPMPREADILDRMELNGVCAGWSDLGPPPVIPAGTAVPTLVLSGQFDPVAGPALSRQVTAAIGGHARWIEFPGIGHNVRAFSPCGAAIAAAFIDRPTQPLDAGCAAEPAP